MMKAIKHFLAASYNSYHQNTINAFLSENITPILQNQDYLTHEDLTQCSYDWYQRYHELVRIYNTYLKFFDNGQVKEHPTYQELAKRLKKYEEASTITLLFTIPCRVALEQGDMQRVFQWSKELIDSNKYYEIKDKEVLGFFVYPYVYMSYLYKKLNGELSQYDTESLAQCKAYTQMNVKIHDVKTRYLNTIEAYITQEHDRDSTLRHFLFASKYYQDNEFGYQLSADPQLKDFEPYFVEYNTLLESDITKEITANHPEYQEVVKHNQAFQDIMQELNEARKNMDVEQMQNQIERLAQHAVQDRQTPENALILNGPEKLQLARGYRYLILPVIQAALNHDIDAMRQAVTTVIKEGRIFMTILPNTHENNQLFYDYAKLALFKCGYMNNEYTQELDSWAHEMNVENSPLVNILLKQESMNQITPMVEKYIQSGQTVDKEDMFMQVCLKDQVMMNHAKSRKIK